jgi:adenylate cyclase
MSAANRLDAGHLGRDVQIRYGDRQISGVRGQRLLDAILGAGIEHRHICGGRGFCTSCRVEVVRDEGGLTPVSHLERERLGREAGRLRLACQARILGSVSVRPPVLQAGRFSPYADEIEPDSDGSTPE